MYLKQCKGNLSQLEFLDLEVLFIQTFQNLDVLKLNEHLKELGIIGIPSLLRVENCNNLENLRINMCMKLQSIPLSLSLRSIDLNVCPQIIKYFQSLKTLSPSFVKINNKILKD